ncbi:uncharacterized protein LOC114746180 [Neltuma alba]|uniref:uncharacterized protein LOC114746180 n=1 Tax=Neltuma alba TaxID=207710 RepID=UPI0010A341E7|nr:uncharacterized protein LOC114746180 [Prosopis alba]
MEEAEEKGRRWVLSKGVRMGKQILLAGLLASSAPVVVPPLVVASVIGISVSIPFGLFLASHACTRKLMSKLLPMPATPSYLARGQKECVGIEMGENEDGGEEEASPAIGDGKKESEHIKQIDDSDVMDSHKPVPSAVTADETQESSNPAVTAVADVRSEYSSATHIMSPPSINKVTANEERLWREINAIRVIVGYEGTPQASCMEELKRLYILAGVEPPSLLSTSCNSLEIRGHLRFLMSVLGVKSKGP